MAIVCVSDKKNIGAAKCRALPQLIKRVMTVPRNFTVTYTNSLLEATWQTLLKNPKSTRGYLLPSIKKIESLSDEATYFTNQLASNLQYQGRYAWRFSFIDGMYNHRALASHRLGVDKIILIDNFGNALFTSDDEGVTLRPLTVDLFNPEKMKFNDETEPTMSPVYVSLDDYTELDRAYLVPMSFINNLLPLTDVSLRIVGSPSATSIVVKVFFTETEDSGTPANEIPILGLDETGADFNLTTTAGGDQNSAISGVTDNEDGTYTVAGSGMASGFIDLVAAGDISDASLAIESTGPATVTIA